MTAMRMAKPAVMMTHSSPNLPRNMTSERNNSTVEMYTRG
jgi:hypothetical protein